jgi:cytochrome c5
MSEAMADAAMVAFAAAEAEDADLIFDLGETVYNTCNACHGLYWVDDADRGRAVAPGD